VPAAVNNIVTAAASQTGPGTNNTNFIPTWIVETNSLIFSQSPSSVGAGNFGQYGAGVVSVLTDGSFGSLNFWPNVGGSITEVTCGSSAGQSVTYTLAGSATGYDLTKSLFTAGGVTRVATSSPTPFIIPRWRARRLSFR